MSNERSELAETIEKALGVVTGIFDTTDDENAELADAVLAAGYRKPRTIATSEELDALPVGSIVRDQIGLALQYRYDGCWWCTNGDTGLTGEDLANEGLPVTVIWEPQP